MKRRKTINTLDKYIIISFVIIVLYTISHTVILGITGNESAVLTVCVFGFFAEEIALCAFLKRTKLIDVFKDVKGKKSDNNITVDEMED